MDWKSLSSGGLGAVQAGLDIRAVAGALGTVFVGDELALCPFHAENTPSLNVFTGEDGKQRWHCHGCGAGGDVVDFVARREGLPFGEAVARCEEFLAQGLPAPSVVRSGSTPADLARTVAEADGGTDPIAEFLLNRESPISLSWLIESFRLKVNSRGEIVIPHYARGADSPVAVKRRDGNKKAAYSGSRLTELYGAWRDQGRPDVVLCEGESDTWLVSWLLREQRVDVLGLPRGVGAQADTAWLEQLAGRNVTLIFDADNPGRSGARRWVTSLRGRGCKVRIALLPETTDASVSASETLTALRRAVPAPDFESMVIFRSSGRYLMRKGKDGEEIAPLTDWALEILSRVELPGESVHYSALLPTGDEVRISHADLRNPDALSRWANKYGLTHSASGAATQHLLRLLEAESVYTARKRGISVLGWEEGRFILPDRVIGTQDVQYVPPQMDARWETRLALGEPVASPQRSAVPVLARMHIPSVMTPILGWVAAAPLRSLCTQFPTLAVMGSAGSGKTTIVNSVLSAFGFSRGTPVTVSNSTWHAVWAMAASTNGIPVWFDEYRAGTRADGVSALEQVIRDAWNGAATLRGGVGENKSALHSLVATAPVVISGEGALQEASHAERSVYVPLTRSGRDPEALAELERLSTEGLGLDYLTWLVRNSEFIPAPPNIPDRPRQAIAVARWGYTVLLEWLATYGLDGRMPEWDASLVEGKQAAMLASNPYLEALRECFNQSDNMTPLVWPEGNDLFVRYGRLPTYLKAKTTIVLPGGERALYDWLMENYEVRTADGRDGRVAILVGAANTLFS